jgi:hypothetical protein
MQAARERRGLEPVEPSSHEGAKAVFLEGMVKGVQEELQKRSDEETGAWYGGWGMSAERVESSDLPKRGEMFREGDRVVYWNFADRGDSVDEALETYISRDGLRPLDVREVFTQYGSKVIVKWEVKPGSRYWSEWEIKSRFAGVPDEETGALSRKQYRRSKRAQRGETVLPYRDTRAIMAADYGATDGDIPLFDHSFGADEDTDVPLFSTRL